MSNCAYLRKPGTYCHGWKSEK